MDGWYAGGAHTYAVPLTDRYFSSRSWYALHPVDPVHPSDRDPLSTIDAQILFDRLLQPILRINSYQTENRMIYGTFAYIYVCMYEHQIYAIVSFAAAGLTSLR